MIGVRHRGGIVVSDPIIMVVMLADPLSWPDAKETSLLSTSLILESVVAS